MSNAYVADRGPQFPKVVLDAIRERDEREGVLSESELADIRRKAIEEVRNEENRSLPVSQRSA